MNPIISPMWFYVIDVLGSLVLALQLVGVLAAFVCFILFFDYIEAKNNEKEKAKNRFRKIALVCCISIALVILIPSKQTAYTMLIAQNMTTDNVLKAGGTAEKAVQRLVNIIVDAAKKMEDKNNE